MARTSLSRAVAATAGRRRVAACAVVMAGALTGCGEPVSGIPIAESATSMHHVDAAPADLLPAPHQFPAAYPAVVLPPQAAVAAAEDLDGVGMGATVSPVECTPPEAELGAEPPAVAVGTDEASRASLTVELSRTTELLARVRDRLRACEQIRVRRAGAGTTVTTEVSAHVPAGADEAMTLRRRVIPDVGGVGLTQTMYTSVGRVGDIRITVTSMTFGAAEPDKAAVDQLFSTTVSTVRTH